MACNDPYCSCCSEKPGPYDYFGGYGPWDISPNTVSFGSPRDEIANMRRELEEVEGKVNDLIALFGQRMGQPQRALRPEDV